MPVHASVGLGLLMIVMLLMAGCVGWLGGSYIRDQDVLITKLNPDGLTEWKTLIDTADYDHALDFIQTSDGGFVIIGGKTQLRCNGWPRNSDPSISTMTRISNTGDILWVRNYSSKIISVIQNKDESFSAISEYGTIVQMSSDGTVVNEIHPDIRNNGIEDRERIDTFTALENGGFLLAGETLVKIDPTGNVSWQQLNDTILSRTYAVTEMKNQQGYLTVIRGEEPLGPSALELDQNGSIVRTIRMENFAEFPLPIIQQTDSGYTILSINAFCPEHSSSCDQIYGAIHLDNSGNKIDSVNLTGADSVTVLPSGDGSFTSYAVISPGTIVKKTKFNRNGSITGEQTSQCSGNSACLSLFGDAPLRTSDGGFAIMRRIEKQQSC
jgi:hypothetical protein